MDLNIFIIQFTILKIFSPNKIVRNFWKSIILRRMELLALKTWLPLCYLILFLSLFFLYFTLTQRVWRLEGILTSFLFALIYLRWKIKAKLLQNRFIIGRRRWRILIFKGCVFLMKLNFLTHLTLTLRMTRIILFFYFFIFFFCPRDPPWLNSLKLLMAR